MASPGELVKAMADVLGVPAANVAHHDRNLHSAGHRTKGGRGRSAAKVAARDAANLLIPVAAGSLIRNTVETFQDYASLPMSDSSFGSISGEPRTPWRQSLPGDHTFGEALTALIESARDGSLRRFRAEQTEGKNGWHPGANFFRLHLEISGPVPSAMIQFTGIKHRQMDGYGHEPPEDDLERREWEAAVRTKYGNGDLRTVRHVSARTIFALGDLLNG